MVPWVTSNVGGWWGHFVSAKRLPTVDAVGVGANRSTHTGDSANMGGGDHYL